MSAGDTERVPNLNADFSEVGEDFPAVEAELEAIWTIICRGWENPTFTIGEDYPPAMLDVFVDREDLTDGEQQDLSLFVSERSAGRPDSRPFSSLTAVEHSILRILRRGARRRIADQDTDDQEGR